MFVLFGTIFSNISVRNMEYQKPTFTLTLSIVFSFQCRLIVAQMSDTRTDAWNALMWPLCFVAFMSCVPVDELLGFAPITVHTERWMVYMLTTFATFAHIHYGHGIVSTSFIQQIIFRTN